MKRIFITAVFAFCLFFVYSCVNTSLSSRTLMKFQKGMSPDTIKSLLEDEIIVKEINIDNINGKHIIVDVYMMSMGQVEGEYLVAFADRKLVYFGYPYEFASHSDKFINEIGKQAMRKFEDN